MAASLLLGACGGGNRPSVAEWEPVWEGFLVEIPAIAELGDPPDRDICSNSLGYVRSSEGDLLPTPDRVIDQAVREWITVADSTFFECPPSSSAIPGLEFAYGQLTRIEAEIDAVLAIDRSEE